MDSVNSKVTLPVSETTTYLDDLTIDINDYSIDMSSITIPNSYSVNVGGTGASGSSYTIGTGLTYTTGAGAGYSWANGVTSNGNLSGSTLQVNGDADFQGDIKIKGKSLVDFMQTLEKRLAILQPDPAKLEKFEALKKAYDHYKLLEALCQEDDGK